MPFYEVIHSFPLTELQKQAFAIKVTELHTRAFRAPSLFVNIVFRPDDIPEGNYFVAGTSKRTCTNRIKALVRTSAVRSKEHFDILGTDIEKAWYEVLAESTDIQGKQLILITFHPTISVRELGLLLPVVSQGHTAAPIFPVLTNHTWAGEEKVWVKQCKGEFERRAEDGDKLFQDMLEEISQRDDLVDWRT